MMKLFRKLYTKFYFLRQRIMTRHGKTGVYVKARIKQPNGDWKTKKLDIADLKPGMRVREIGALREVTGTYFDDGEDYMIPLDDNEVYSPLLIE